MLGLGLSLTGGAVTRGGVSPSLDLDFMAGTMPAAVTFSRTSSATRFNSAGMLETVAAGVPRFDHDPVTLAPRGLLVEEARTNLIAGQMSNATYWPAVSVSRGAGVTAPDGSAGTMVTENAGGTAAYGLNSQNVAITAAPITGSIYAKAGTCPWLRVMLADAGAPTTSAHAFFNLLTGEIGISGASGSAGGLPTGISAIIQPVGAGWYRCMLTATLAAHTTASLLLRMVSGNGASSDAGGNTMHFYAPQLEQGAFATSPILSTTTAASRAVDVASIASLVGWFNASSGTLFVEAAIPGLVTNKNILTVSDGTNAEVLQFNTTGGGAVRFSVTDGNVSQAAITSSLTAIPDTAFKAAAAYGPNDFAVSGNGGTVATDASGTLPTVDRIHLAASGTGFSNTSVMFRKIRYWQVRRPNSDLQQITAI